MEKFLPDLATQGLDLDDPQDQQLFADFAQARTYVSMLLGETRSPFVAYLAGQMESAGTPGAPPEPIAASLELASDLGDPRAACMSERFSTSHPGMNANLVMIAYSGLSASATR
ncbi:MAG: hypothetical protein Q4F49_02235 [Pseudoxanthomonas suwonensis]|nr:hypothetical protein [Pseudoxanthomonas suwonensis]